MPRFGQLTAVAAITLLLVIAGWYFASPHVVMERLGNWDTSPTERLDLYDRAALRKGFEAQMLPQVDEYPPPFTKAVVLDALTHPDSVRLLVMEPYGEWQFAAAEGLPPKLKDNENDFPMPRLMEVAESWEVDWQGLNRMVVRGADRSPSNAYRFRRDGLGWTLEHIELTEAIR